MRVPDEVSAPPVGGGGGGDGAGRVAPTTKALAVMRDLDDAVSVSTIRRSSALAVPSTQAMKAMTQLPDEQQRSLAAAFGAAHDAHGEDGAVAALASVR
jgi:hypothetical protein